MIDQTLKRSLGQAMHAISVVGAAHAGREHLFTSHWVMQISFEEPILIASVSPKHDTHAALAASGVFSVSMLAGDQVAEGQYFSYPGRKFHNLATEYVTDWGGLPVVPNAIAWMRCEVIEQITAGAAGALDHDLFLARVTAVEALRLKEPPLLYSSRLGWRIAGGPAREPGTSVRDVLLARLEASGLGGGDANSDSTDDE
jgi:flavin reductase (DIM6/NTAB) family NADH-FMN oxidoreductase RutF